MTDSQLIFGVDVSHAQGEVDFAALATDTQPDRPPFGFAIVKATEGGDFEDPSFRSSWAKLRALDPAAGGTPSLIRGVYHFARPDHRTGLSGEAAGAAEAGWFCDVLEQVGGFGAGCLPPFIDWEKRSGTSSRDRAWLTSFLQVASERLGRTLGLYTGPGVWKATTDNWEGLIDHVTLWQVQYQSDGWDGAVAYPKRRLLSGQRPWPWQLWQWSGGGDYNYYAPKYGQVPGISGGVADVDRFDGGMQALRALALLDGQQPSKPTLSNFSRPDPKSQLGSGVFPRADLADFGSSSFVKLVAVVQGLLLAAKHGPDGLVGRDGLPDGKAGPKTLAALRAYKQERDLPANTVVDGHTWVSLLQT